MNETLAALWQARYRENAPTEALAFSENATVRDLIAHRSVRAYLSEPLPAGALEIAVAAAQSAATSSNLQAWSVIAVEDPERRARLATLSGEQKHVAAAPLFLAWIADLSRLERLAQRHHTTADALDYTETFMLATIDASLAAQNAVAAFESLGLGTVYIGGLRNHPEAVAKELNLPPRAFALFGLCVGYPDPAQPAAIKPRLPQKAVLHREGYDAAAEESLIAEYNARADSFQQEQGLPPRAWSEAMVRRIAKKEGLHGREIMHESLEKLGFPLK